MKQFENKVLFIKDESMLEEVSELAMKNNIYVDEKYTLLGYEYLYYSVLMKKFVFFEKTEKDHEITLDEFKELLKIK